MKDSGREQSDCPVCKMPLNAHTNTTDRGAPRTGDYTICLYCGSVLRFGPVGLRTLNAREQAIADADANIQRAKKMVAEIHREGRVRE